MEWDIAVVDYQVGWAKPCSGVPNTGIVGHAALCADLRLLQKAFTGQLTQTSDGEGA